ncbi:hypothetical protein BJV82DRAFT_607194 [Fennellomyces sp. T-0311]|nr:hypothetical protein BJV82DRAFT_607194 [Fennellomyces sp. T-0311]
MSQAMSQNEREVFDMKVEDRKYIMRDLLASQGTYQRTACYEHPGKNQLNDPKFVVAEPPVDTDLIAIIGYSVSPVVEQGIYIGAYGISWWDQMYPAQAGSYVDFIGNELLACLKGLRAALAACKPHESITFISRMEQFTNFLNEGKIRGRRKGISQEIENEALEAIRSRPGRVQGLELKEDWVIPVQKYAGRLAQTARKLRLLVDPNSSHDQQLTLASMAEPKIFQLDAFSSIQHISLASLQVPYSSQTQARPSTSAAVTRSHVPPPSINTAVAKGYIPPPPASPEPSPQDWYTPTTWTRSSVVPSVPCQTKASTPPALADMRFSALPQGGGNDIDLARPPLAVHSVVVGDSLTTANGEMVETDHTREDIIRSSAKPLQASMKRAREEEDGESSNKSQKRYREQKADKQSPKDWRSWARSIFQI